MTLLIKRSALVLLALCSAPTYAQNAGPVELVDGLEAVFGTHAGARRSGAKGVCASGYFVGTKDGAALSSASAFSGAKIPVVARYSIGGGNPKAPDKSKSVRGLALQFDLPNSEQWLMANISAPVFSAATPQSFLEFLQARAVDPATKKMDPAKVAASNASHPDHKPQIDYVNSFGVPASFAGLNYWGVNSFKFTNAAGAEQYGKWVFESATGQERFSDDILPRVPDVFLNDELRARVAKGVVEYNFKVQLAKDGDVIDNPTIVWPESRRTVTAGKLYITKVEADGEGACSPINFNPVVTPKGVDASSDPILQARSGSYAVSQGRRLSSGK